MTGTGTQNDPYVVVTWNEFAQVFQASGDGKYIELGADIIAPDTPVNLESVGSGISQLDGKGYSIVGLTTNEGYALTFNGSNQHVHTTTIKNISFNNTNCQGTSFIRLSYISDNLSNIVVNGNIFTNSVIETSGYFKSVSCGGNIHINLPDFKLINLTTSGSINRTLSFNKWTVDYGNISLSANNDFLSSNISADNCEFNIHADSTNSVNFGNAHYCTFYGSGSVKINAHGVNVIEDTLTLDSGSTGNNHILTTADMKNIQLLYDLGFPASGVV